MDEFKKIYLEDLKQGTALFTFFNDVQIKVINYLIKAYNLKLLEIVNFEGNKAIIAEDSKHHKLAYLFHYYIDDVHCYTTSKKRNEADTSIYLHLCYYMEDSKCDMKNGFFTVSVKGFTKDIINGFDSSKNNRKYLKQNKDYLEVVKDDGGVLFVAFPKVEHVDDWGII